MRETLTRVAVTQENIVLPRLSALAEGAGRTPSSSKRLSIVGPPSSSCCFNVLPGSVLERIPPRVRVRRDAPIELPHVMLLIDDPKKICVEPVTAAKDSILR